MKIKELFLEAVTILDNPNVQMRTLSCLEATRMAGDLVAFNRAPAVIPRPN